LQLKKTFYSSVNNLANAVFHILFIYFNSFLLKKIS